MEKLLHGEDIGGTIAMVLVITAQGFMDMDTMGMALDTTDIIITMGGDITTGSFSGLV